MNKQEESSCEIKRAYGSANHSVRDEIIAACGKKPPLLAWAEPQADWYGHGTGRHPQFVPLQRLQGATPDWPEDLPLAEARLFWPGGALHIVANEYGGCRWASFEESGNNGRCDGNSITVNRKESTVYLLLSKNGKVPRFGLADEMISVQKIWSSWRALLIRVGLQVGQPRPGKMEPELIVVTYRKNGRYVGWRLTLK